MRICFVCSEYPPARHGGIGSFTRQMAQALVARGHDIRVIGVYDGDRADPPYQENEGVQIWRLREPRLRYVGWSWSRYQLFKTIRRWALDGEIDLVEVPDYQGWAAGWPSLPVPVVTRLHGSSSYVAQEAGRRVRRLVFLFERASLRRSDSWVSVSRYTAVKTRQVFGLASEPAAILYNPVKVPPRLVRAERTTNRVVFAGTLTATKGVISLVEAWPAVVNRCPAAELHLFGKDGRTASGETMSAHLLSLLDPELKQTVFLHGHVSQGELFEALQMARVAVFPSFVESFALGPLEAMACGCPTIFTTRVSGPELINHGQDGLLVDPDNRDEISDSVVSVLKSDDLAQQLSQAGQARITDSFTFEKRILENEQFYSDCLRAFPALRNRCKKASDTTNGLAADRTSNGSTPATETSTK